MGAHPSTVALPIKTVNRNNKTDSSEYVRAEYLLAELLNQVAENDYTAQSTAAIDKFEPNFFGAPVSPAELSAFDASQSFGVEEAYVMVEQGYLEMENGLVQRIDGSWFLAIHTDLGNKVDGDLFDWWLRQCDDSEKYKWAHPESNVSCTWDPTFYRSMPHERQRCYYIDHVQYVEKSFAGVFMSLQIEYLRPSKYFDITLFKENKITACVIGRVHINDPRLGLVGLGYLTHIVREVDGKGKSECRTRLWLGEITFPETVNNFLFARWINWLASFPSYRSRKLPEAQAQAIRTHFAEELHSLSAFLPKYYEHTRAKLEAEIGRLSLQQ